MILHSAKPIGTRFVDRKGNALELRTGFVGENGFDRRLNIALQREHACAILSTEVDAIKVWFPLKRETAHDQSC